MSWIDLWFLAFQSTFQLVCVFIYLAFIVYFLLIEIRSLVRLKGKYFCRARSYLELGLTACSWASVGIHIWRFNEAHRIGSLFRESQGNTYINFQLMAYINDTFSFLLAFCCFFGTMKFLRLCRYDRRLSLLSETLRRANRELLSFTFMFSIVLMAFLALFHLTFMTKIQACSSFLQTIQLLFKMMILKFNPAPLTEASPLLGRFYFTLFIIFVVFVCINMFVSIVNDNFRLVRADLCRVDETNQYVFSRIFQKLQQWCSKSEWKIFFGSFSVLL